MDRIEVRPDGIYLDGEKFFMLSGDFHYFRTLPGGWKRRMELMKDFGITAITTYVSWNLHEPKKGEFCFEGLCDLDLFLRTAEEVGLKVVMRCSPYMCSEWDMGGLPAWLLKDRTMCVRSSDRSFMAHVEDYNKVLCDVLRPHLYTNGGSIIFFGLENEYGSFGSDREYLCLLRDNYRANGIDVPFLSANGVDPFKYKNGVLEENWNGVDAQAGPGALNDLKKLQAMDLGKPLMAGEAWVGRILFWGRPYALNQEIEPAAEYFKAALEMGTAVNFYMFCGGTNFGFTSGSLDHTGIVKFSPLLTSYDYDAPVSEEGTPRAKYFALRDVLDEYLGKPARPHLAPDWRAQTISGVKLTESAPLFQNTGVLAEKTVKANRTISMEDLDQNFGFIRYTTFLRYGDPRKYHLKIEGLADRATCYLDGRYIGTYMRDEPSEDIVFTIPEGGAELSILVENTGRIDYGYNIYDRKGILGCVRFDIEQPDGSFLFNLANCMGFTIETLPLEKLDGIAYGTEFEEHNPNFLRGSFTAEPGVDSFLDMGGWEKGVVWVNGFNLGRYWSVGPQRTLYVPGELLKEENTIEILELHAPKADRTVDFIDHSLLCEPVAKDAYNGEFELK